MNKDTIIRLLCGEHISITERINLGIMNNEPLKFKELVVILSEIIKGQRYFPRPYKQNEDSKAIYEGAVIERISEKEFIYYIQRAQAFSPFLIAEKRRIIFNDAQIVASCYLENELHLPGDLDGFKVVK
jgi:hypothetical protein